jgi:hypothetical protein
MLRARQEAQQAARRAAEDDARARAAARRRAADEDPVPAGTLVVLQGNAFRAEGGGTVSVAPNKRGATGPSIFRWDGAGHWLDYTVTVPAAGYYHLTLVYCSDLDLIERALEVNGTDPEPFAPIVFAGTGGWANDADDWRLFTLPDPAVDGPLLIRLDAGENTVRLINVNGRGLNIDLLAVHSPDVTPTREQLADAIAP